MSRARRDRASEQQSPLRLLVRAAIRFTDGVEGSRAELEQAARAYTEILDDHDRGRIGYDARTVNRWRRA